MAAPVVVAWDCSQQSLAAVEAAAVEAALRGRALRIVHVFAMPGVPPVADPIMSPRFMQSCRNAAEDEVIQAAGVACAAVPGLGITTRVLPGPAVSALLAESRGADLLILAQARALLPVAMRAACPVVVVRGRECPNGPVVVAVDGSGTSPRAVAFAAEEAVLRQTELVALRTYDRDDDAELERWILAGELAGIAVQYPELMIRPQIRCGSARHALTDWSGAAQLVVVAGRTGPLHGTVGRHLLKHSSCPVAVVRS
jgi:nucleotide-binding universal stress UspA family protein